MLAFLSLKCRKYRLCSLLADLNQEACLQKWRQRGLISPPCGCCDVSRPWALFFGQTGAQSPSTQRWMGVCSRAASTLPPFGSVSAPASLDNLGEPQGESLVGFLGGNGSSMADGAQVHPAPLNGKLKLLGPRGADFHPRPGDPLWD